MIVIILSSASLAISIIALCISIKNKGVKEVITHEKTIEVVKPTVETPFTVDGNGDYTLDGNLRVTGCVSLFKKGGQ